MFERLTRQRSLVLWQLLFLILGTTWLWAPHLNDGLSYRTSLISQYETPFQPYAWLFRCSDFLAGVLLLVMALAFIREPAKKTVGWVLFVISLGLITDPLLTTTCHFDGNSCTEYLSLNFIAHAVETTITSSALFLLAVYDGWLRKKIVSVGFALFQVGYGVLFVSQLANHERFNTVSQFVYQTALVVWLAWFTRDFLIGSNFKTRGYELKLVKMLAAVWAFINGILAILISLAHIHLLGKIKGLYFAGDSAWLAQHGVIIGVVLLYISRHLARGEVRARQIFLAISGIEALKYSVITPNPALMLLYLVTFCLLFVLRDDFDRGIVPLTWRVRLKDLYFMISALLLAITAVLLTLDRDSRVSLVTGRAFDNFFDYVAGSDFAARSHLRSALLAHTISAFLVASIGAVLWILFRPYKNRPGSGRDYRRVESLLKDKSDSSEDFFKLWPQDKDYFWQHDGNGFVAYKIVGPVVFALADPVSAGKKELLEEFMAWAKGRRLTPCFLPVYSGSLKMYKQAGLETQQIGSSAVINISQFLKTTSNDKWWRWKRNRAEKSGYQFSIAVPPHSTDLMQKLKRVSDMWLTIDGRAERGFALGYFDEDYLSRCRIYCLRDQAGKVLAFTNQVSVFNKSQTLTVDLLRYVPDVDAAMPYLLYKTIESTVAEDLEYKFFDLGFVPFARAKGPLLAIARTLSAGRFSSRGLEQFKDKFEPDWQPNYMAYDGDLADLALIALNLEKAMDQELQALPH